jgi:hypothetical protein
MNGEDNMEVLVAMEICLFPHVISWIGKNDVGRSLLYKLFQCMIRKVMQNLLGQRGRECEIDYMNLDNYTQVIGDNTLDYT